MLINKISARPNEEGGLSSRFNKNKKLKNTKWSTKNKNVRDAAIIENDGTKNQVLISR